MLKNLKVSLFLAYRSLKRSNIGTTILTVIIMSLIFVNLIFMPSIIEGLGEAMTVSSIDGVYGHVFIGPKEDNIYINNVDSIQKKLNTLPGVVGTAPRYVTGATFSHKNKFKGGALYSMNPEDELVVTKIHTGLIEGEFLSKSDTDEILLGTDISGEEGGEDDESNLGGVKVGDKIGVTFSNGVVKEYRLKGIFAISKMNVDRLAFITEKEMESVLGEDNKASQILVKLSQRGTEEEFRKKFRELGISEDIKTGEEKMAGPLGSILSIFGIITLISTAIGLTMAVVIIFIIIYINTVHKRKQIGILKAIGIDQGVIICSYIIQALFYCFSGVILGSILLWVLVSYLTANPTMTPVGYLKPVVEQQLIIQNIISLIVVSLIAGFIPSWRTARENILKSIWG
jgi:putative ABC transport system permease protein